MSFQIKKNINKYIYIVEINNRTLNDVKNFPKNINLETLNIIGLIIV